ncbi:MAG: carboxypeptidase-like regulatory domain-containing protein, partial [Microthrixaceae bacterium]
MVRARSDRWNSDGRDGGAWRGLVALLATFVMIAVVAPVLPADAATGDFTVTVSPASQKLKPGSTAQYLVDVTSVGGFAEPVSLSVRQQDGSPLPTGVTGAFSPVTVTPTGSSKLTVTASNSVPTGSLSLRIIATGGGLTRTSDASASVDLALVERCTVDVSGVVREGGGSGAPIAGATVATTTFPPVIATTDAAGAYKLTGLALGDNNAPVVGLSIKASKNPPASTRVGTYWSSSKSTDLVCGRLPKLDFELVKVVPASVAGTVLEGRLGADGVTVEPLNPPVPVVGAKALIPGVAEATTVAGGTYKFVDSTGVDGVQLGEGNAPTTLNIKVNGPTTAPVRSRFWPGATSVGPVSPGTSVQAPPALLVRQCTVGVSGTVVDDATGAPIGGAAVRLDASDKSDAATTTTALDGSFSVPAVMFGTNNVPAPLTVTVSKAAAASSPAYTTLVTATATPACGGTLQQAVRLKSTGSG